MDLNCSGEGGVLQFKRAATVAAAAAAAAAAAGFMFAMRRLLWRRQHLLTAAATRSSVCAIADREAQPLHAAAVVTIAHAHACCHADLYSAASTAFAARQHRSLAQRPRHMTHQHRLDYSRPQQGVTTRKHYLQHSACG
jgi:hypothetical protein